MCKLLEELDRKSVKNCECKTKSCNILNVIYFAHELHILTRVQSLSNTRNVKMRLMNGSPFRICLVAICRIIFVMTKKALLIGNSDGIGAGTTKRLLESGFQIIGISRSDLAIEHPNYRHLVQDVSSEKYRARLIEALDSFSQLDLCIYFAGTGQRLDLENLFNETKVFEVNLMSAVITTELVLGKMLAQGNGHFIGLSSVVDSLISSETPSYCASKSGISKFWEGLGLATRDKNIKVSNIRFGFVDTKMAKSSVKPFLISVDEAVEFIFDVISRPRVRATKPKAILPLVWLIGLPNKLKLLVE
jgi:short-subunit dehydrogenase